MENNNELIMPMVFNFNKAFEIPSYKYNKSRQFIEWGDGNEFPTFLNELYAATGHAVHKSIIDRKVKMMVGKGFEDENMEQYNEDLNRIALDYEIFDGFSFEVIYANDKSVVEINHVPFSKVRIGIQDEEYLDPYFWYSKDWKKYRKAGYEPEYIRKWDGDYKEERVLYWYSTYSPLTDHLYPLPSYSASINSISIGYIDIEIDGELFTINPPQAKNGDNNWLSYGGNFGFYVEVCNL